MRHPELARRRTWTITGIAGFIGSHIGEALLAMGQDVVGLDDLSTGSRENISLLAAAAEKGAGTFRFHEGSVERAEMCAQACAGADVVLHQAALGSIPRSIENPARTHQVNATGTLNMLAAARDAGTRRFVFASSSSVYGDDSTLPKREDRVGMPLAPYASSKAAGEHYARNFADHYGLQTVGLRYFNVFGPRQDPNGAYAAVIPRWISSLAGRRRTTIYGDGSTSRDFCYVANIVQANLLAATYDQYTSATSIFNIANGGRTSLNDLYGHIVRLLEGDAPPPDYAPERPGDVRHSQADISRARSVLGYAPTHDVISGLSETVGWYREFASS